MLNKNGGISDYTLYSLGILDPDELNDLLMDALASEDLDVPDTNVEFTQEEALALTFKVVNECDMYTRASSGSTWVDRSDDDGYMKAQIADGLDLKVVGIIKPSATASSTSMDEGIGYRHDLILHLIEQAASSPVVEAQMAEPDVDIFTGKTFESLKDDAESSFDMGSLFSIDQNMMARAFNVDSAAIEAAMASAMSGAAAGLDTSNMFADIPAPDFSDLDIDVSAGMPSASQVAALEQSLGQMSSGVVMGFMQYVSSNPGSMADLPGAWSAYQQSDAYRTIINQTATGIASGHVRLQRATPEGLYRCHPEEDERVYDRAARAVPADEDGNHVAELHYEPGKLHGQRSLECHGLGSLGRSEHVRALHHRQHGPGRTHFHVHEPRA